MEVPALDQFPCKTILKVGLLFLCPVLMAAEWTPPGPWNFDPGARLQQIIETRDRKEALILPWDPYHENSSQLSKNQALKRLRRFANTYVSDQLKKKTGFLTKTISRSSTVSNDEQKNEDDSFNYEMKYRVRGRRFQIELVNSIVNISGIAEISGRPRLQMTKDFGELTCHYVFYLDNNNQEVSFNRPLFSGLEASTTLSFGPGSGEETPESKLHLRYSLPF